MLNADSTEIVRLRFRPCDFIEIAANSKPYAEVDPSDSDGFRIFGVPFLPQKHDSWTQKSPPSAGNHPGSSRNQDFPSVKNSLQVLQNIRL